MAKQPGRENKNESSTDMRSEEKEQMGEGVIERLVDGLMRRDTWKNRKRGTSRSLQESCRGGFPAGTVKGYISRMVELLLSDLSQRLWKQRVPLVIFITTFTSRDAYHAGGLAT